MMHGKGLQTLIASVALMTLSIGCSLANPQVLAATAGDNASPNSGTTLLVVPDTLRAEQVDKFVAPLSDIQARALLIDRLRKGAPENIDEVHTASSRFADFLGGVRYTIAKLAKRLDALGQAANDLPDTLEFMGDLLTDQEGFEAMKPGLNALLMMLLAGTLGAYLANRICRQPRAAIASATPTATVAKAAFLAGRLMLDVVNVAVFALVGFALSFVYFDDVSPMRLFAVTYLSVAAATYLAYTVGRFLFAPAMPDKRLVPMSTPAARRNSASFVVLTAIMASGIFSAGFLQIIGADNDTLALLQLAILVAFTLALFAHLLLLPAVDDVEPGLFRQWRWLSMLYVLIVTGIWGINIILDQDQVAIAAFLSIFLMLSIPALDRALRRSSLTGTELADENRVQPGRSGERLVRFGAGILVMCGALVALVEAATGTIMPWLATPAGTAVAGAMARVTVTTIVACSAWAIIRGLIDAAVNREMAKALAAAAEEGEEGESEGGSGVVGTRTQTLLPLLRGTVFFAITGIAIMTILSAIGIDIGPLLAGAGVVGLAIGFGAQALVKDVVSGVFFLIDDAFRIGEYIEMEELRGEVEKISIRSMQLRHHKGPVQTVPFGEIKSITNYNRDWVIYKQEFRVPYETNLEQVRKLIKKLGQRMLEHPEYGQFFLEQLKSQGVRRIEDSALIIGTKFMCKPRRQFVLRRHVYQEIQTLFHDNGIEFARRRVIVEGASSAKGAAAALEDEANAPEPSQSR
ncbi:MAG: mechanosensitive ion channel family protein [Chromatiales bacterium]|jgi:moderate conductance mechanosensitive channel|nr:mechanosensitive ion channel family protein [Chromatiales bacterium]